jgi:hypothetical protein
MKMNSNLIISQFLNLTINHSAFAKIKFKHLLHYKMDKG